MKRLCFYHAGCPDGFGAAWALWTQWGDTGEYIPRGHDEPIPANAYESDLVVFVDNVPGNQALKKLSPAAGRMIVLDHHITSQERYQSDLELQTSLEENGHWVHFDMNHSGAVLSWNHFRPGEAVPDFLQYVEDQDLWNWALPYSQEVNAAIASYPRTFEMWSDLVERPLQELIDEGTPLVRAQKIQIDQALTHAHPVLVAGEKIEAVNHTSHLRSSIGHELALRNQYGKPWGLVYRVVGSQIHATLYSIGDLNVARIAQKLGGGGHPNAAGFQVSLSEWATKYL